MVSILKTDKIQASHGSTIEIPSGHVLQAPGHVLQTLTAAKTDVFSTTSQFSIPDLTFLYCLPFNKKYTLVT